MMEPGLTGAQLSDAINVGDRFWTALGADLDAAVAVLLMPETLEYLTSAPGLAQRIRSHLRISPEECQRVGFYSEIEVLPDQQARIFYLVSEVKRAVAPTETGWRIEFALRDGTWLVDPIRAHTLKAIAMASPVDDDRTGRLQ